uniref:Transposase (putative) gypsy type domain-containing protein n=1 Tax=Helianthus annuus TaxID=4232 RepID=A0A251RPF2_HELAN
MVPGKDNLADSVSVLTPRQFDKFVREYRIPLDLHPVLPSRTEVIYPFRQGKFPFYTRVCNFANYRVPFSRFLIKVLQFFRVHISQVNPFGLSRVNHFELSCRALDQKPDLNVFRYFYKFITAGDWYTFAHRENVPSPSSNERSSLKNWKDNFFWLDDRCLLEDMRWRFKDQSMSFDLDEDFVFNESLGRALVEHQSPIRPLPEHFLWLGRVSFSWARGDKDWPIIRRKSDRAAMSLLDALKVPSMDVFYFDFEQQGEEDVPLMKHVAPSAHPIRGQTDPNVTTSSAAEATSSVPKSPSERDAIKTVSLIPISSKEAGGSSGSQTGRKSILDDVDDDPEIRGLDEALLSRHSSLKSKGIELGADLTIRSRKRKNETVQIRSSDPLLMPKLKKTKGDSHSEGNIMEELDEHLTGGKFSREEAALARNKPAPVYSGGFVPDSEVESMEVENPVGTDKGKAHSEPKVVTFSGTHLGSSLGPDCFLDDEEDQVSSLPSSWFGPELMSFFRYADLFSDDMEIDPVTAEEKFIPDWDIRNKDTVMDTLTARTMLFNINTPIDHVRSRKMKNPDLGVAVLTNQAQSNIFVTELYRRWIEAESVRENLEKEIRSLKRKVQRSPEVEKKIAQLTQDLRTQQEKVNSLTAQNQSSQAAAAAAAEDRDKISSEFKVFSESMKQKDEEHKMVLAKMEESLNKARLAYESMMAA